MGIQPIDLQTMYSQLSNVSKSLSGVQQAQLTEAMQQQSNIQKGIENATKVHETSKRIVQFDGPHPGNELYRYQVKMVIRFLKEVGEL